MKGSRWKKVILKAKTEDVGCPGVGGSSPQSVEESSAPPCDYLDGVMWSYPGVRVEEPGIYLPRSVSGEEGGGQYVIQSDGSSRLPYVPQPLGHGYPSSYDGDSRPNPDTAPQVVSAPVSSNVDPSRGNSCCSPSQVNVNISMIPVEKHNPDSSNVHCVCPKSCSNLICCKPGFAKVDDLSMGVAAIVGGDKAEAVASMGAIKEREQTATVVSVDASMGATGEGEKTGAVVSVDASMGATGAREKTGAVVSVDASMGATGAREKTGAVMGIGQQDAVEGVGELNRSEEIRAISTPISSGVFKKDTPYPRDSAYIYPGADNAGSPAFKVIIR